MFFIVLLVLLGLLFLLAELVFLPGVTLGGILSLLCYGSAVYMAFDGYGTGAGIAVVAVIAAASLAVTVVALRAKTWQRFSLKQKIDSSSMALPVTESVKAGDRGVAVSRLSPIGKVEIGGRIYEAKSADAYIDQRSEVEVTGFENFSVVVRRVRR